MARLSWVGWFHPGPHLDDCKPMSYVIPPPSHLPPPPTTGSGPVLDFAEGPKRPPGSHVTSLCSKLPCVDLAAPAFRAGCTEELSQLDDCHQAPTASAPYSAVDMGPCSFKTPFLFLIDMDLPMAHQQHPVFGLLIISMPPPGHVV